MRERAVLKCTRDEYVKWMEMLANYWAERLGLETVRKMWEQNHSQPQSAAGDYNRNGTELKMPSEEVAGV